MIRHEPEPLAREHASPLLPDFSTNERAVSLLRELAARMRRDRAALCAEWLKRIEDAQLLQALPPEIRSAEAGNVYDHYVHILETQDWAALRQFAQDFAERTLARGVEVHELIQGALLLRDVVARSFAPEYRPDSEKFDLFITTYTPSATHISVELTRGFIQQREQVIREQQDAIRELSTPVLQVRERLLILPIIGAIDSLRSRQLTEQLLRAIRAHRAKVVVIDITGVAAMDSNVANHLVQTVEASRLLGATVIVSGLSPEIAQTLVHIGVNLSKMQTVGDLQGGIEEAERLLGYRVVPVQETPAQSESA